MPENNRGIGSVGLEQGGPNLGNDYSRPDLSVGNAGDALSTPNTTELKKDDDETLAMDQESDRDLSDEDDVDVVDADDDIDDDDELVDDDFDVDDDEEDFSDLDADDDDEDEDNQLERGI